MARAVARVLSVAVPPGCMHTECMCKRLLGILLGILASGFLVSCATTSGGGGGASTAPRAGNSPAEQQRARDIAAEPRGSHYIGRRYHVDKTRFWGYLRKPGQSWRSAKLVIINESQKLSPDRLPERPVGSSSRFSFDHNYEYKIYGRFSGKEVYDPNANLFLPEFILTNYELIDASPGFLLMPNESYSPKRLPWVPGR